MGELKSKHHNLTRRHLKLKRAVRKFLEDFRAGTYDDWQESLGVLRMLTERRPPEGKTGG